MIYTASRLKLLLVVIAAVTPVVLCATDDTLVELTRGKDVTEATLRKISNSGIFLPDNSFLKRLAFVESRFGEANNTFREDYFGGIWQVEESVFRITQSNTPYLQHVTTLVKVQLEIDWSTVTWRDLTKPLYSGLAAAIYFERVAEIPAHIPETIAEQADHWRKYYRPLGEIGIFKNDSEELRNQTRCRGKMDLCIVLDGSGSIDNNAPGSFKKAQEFVASLIRSFTLDYTRIGMLIFNELEQNVIFEINNNDTIDKLAERALNATYPKGGTRTDRAILRAIQMFNTSASTREDGVPKIMTVFTDGQSQNGSNIPGAVAAIRNNTIKSISIGIGTGIVKEELLQIALNDNSSVFYLANFNNLQDFLQQITSVTCEIPQEPMVGKEYHDSLTQQESRTYRMEPPSEGITVNITTTAGKTAGYWSYTEKVPSSAINDGVIDGLKFIAAPAKATKQIQAEEEKSIYLSIQGVEEKNNYTLLLVEGNKEPPTSGVAAVTSLATFTGFLVLAIHCLFH